MKKAFSIILAAILSINNLNAVIVASHHHYGEIIFIESHYKDDVILVGSEKEFAKNGLINAITNVKYDYSKKDLYPNNPVYYRIVECVYQYSGCGHRFVGNRIEILNEKVSGVDLYKWERKTNKSWYHDYDWENDEYTPNMLFLVVSLVIIFLVAILFCGLITLVELKPRPPVTLSYNYKRGEYESCND